MAYIQQPLNQSEFKMKIIEDLGQQYSNTSTAQKYRYAIFECTKCHEAFKARASGKAAKMQTTCHACTLNPLQTCKHPLYAIWNGIKQRCYSTKRKDYVRYGGVGVTMCDEWLNSPQVFIDWCLANGWKSSLVVDKDILSSKLGITPAIYSPDTISFITTQQNAEAANAKQVSQFTLDGVFIATHVSCVAAATSVDKPSSKSSIANCCRGLTKTSFGFKWKYV